MKKIALVAVLATSAAMAAPFNGFSVGASVGTTFNNTTTTNTTLPKIDKNSFIGSVFAGYTKSFNNMFAGLDLGISYESASKKNKKDATTDTQITYKPGITFSVSPRLGYKFNDTMGAYIKLGLAYSKDESTVKVTGTADEKDKQKSFIFTPALGLEKAFCNNVSVRGEVGYVIGKKETFKNVAEIKRKGIVANIAAVYNF